VEELGLFPLALVLLPTEKIPLHIFEPRYKELIGECVARDGEFGLLLEGAEVGTRAAVTEVLQRLPDGRLNVVVEGRARFRVVTMTTGRSFLTAQVEPVEDDDDPADAGQVQRAAEVFRRLADLTETQVDWPDPESPLIAFELAARVDFGNELKQELLELRSPQERIVRLTELLERATEAVTLEREVRDRASGNGKVTPLRPDG
jgi:Lon protease-like protein